MRADSFTLRFYLALDKQLGTGEYPIYARITINRQKAEISTRQHIDNPEDWDEIIQRVRQKTPINTVLSKIEGDIRSIYDRLKYGEKEISPSIVKNIFLGRAETSPLLIDIMDKYYRDRVLANTSTTQGTRNNYKATHVHVSNFLQ